MNIGNLWLSPEGDLTYCDSHFYAAENIVANRYGIKVKNPKDYLLSLGWMLHISRPWGNYWFLDPEFEEPTQAQQNTIFDLTGELFER